jgi:aminoglycoside 3-N-acetyltransferase
MWTRDELATAFRAVGVGARDLLLVHSALRRLGPVEGGAETVIDALLDAVGPAGTVAVPTHTWQVVGAKQPVFHQVYTPSNVGALTNVFRARAAALRSLAPTHSVAAIGPRAAAFTADHECDSTPCAAAGPYGRLRNWGGKVLIIGPGLECCTFFHGCEEWAELPDAVSAVPIQLYSIDAAGTVHPVALHHHVVNTWDQYPRLESGLIAVGALTVGRIGDCPLRLLDARRAADWLVPRLREDASIILPVPIS